MSDEVVLTPLSAVVPDVSAPGSAGNMLRVAREAAGLHIGALAVSLKVPVKKLEALEGDRIDLLPDAVFARALASSVCRTLKIDPTPVLANLPQVTLSRLLPEAAGERDSFRVTGQGASKPMLQDLPKPFVAIGLALVIGAVVVAFYPDKDSPPNKSANVSSSVSAAQSSDVGSQVVMPTLLVPTEPAQLAASQPVNALAATMKSVVVSEPVLAVTPTQLPQTAPLLALPPPALAASKPMPVSLSPSVSTGMASGTGLVVFKSKSTAWVEVVDATRVVQLRKTLAAGESVDVSGALPLSIIVGKADSTEVLVRGKAFDLTPVAKDNVARFEVR